jgi:hypothetical protein
LQEASPEVRKEEMKSGCYTEKSEGKKFGDKDTRRIFAVRSKKLASSSKYRMSVEDLETFGNGRKFLLS